MGKNDSGKNILIPTPILWCLILGPVGLSNLGTLSISESVQEASINECANDHDALLSRIEENGRQLERIDSNTRQFTSRWIELHNRQIERAEEQRAWNAEKGRQIKENARTLSGLEDAVRVLVKDR